MNIRKCTLITSLCLLTTLLLVACGNKEESLNRSKGKVFDKKESDVVDERSEIVDGQRMTVKTFSDGTEITLPEGLNLDDIMIQGAE